MIAIIPIVPRKICEPIFELKNGKTVTPAVGNVHTNSGFSFFYSRMDRQTERWMVTTGNAAC